MFLNTAESFKVGDYVKVSPATDAWMQGFTSGRVVKVGRRWVHVRWTMNYRIKRKFSPSLLEHCHADFTTDGKRAAASRAQVR